MKNLFSMLVFSIALILYASGSTSPPAVDQIDQCYVVDEGQPMNVNACMAYELGSIELAYDYRRASTFELASDWQDSYVSIVTTEGYNSVAFYLRC